MRQNLKWTGVIIVFLILPELIGRIVYKYIIPKQTVPAFYWGVGILTIAVVAGILYVIRIMVEKFQKKR